MRKESVREDTAPRRVAGAMMPVPTREAQGGRCQRRAGGPRSGQVRMPGRSAACPATRWRPGRCTGAAGAGAPTAGLTNAGRSSPCRPGPPAPLREGGSGWCSGRQRPASERWACHGARAGWACTQALSRAPIATREGPCPPTPPSRAEVATCAASRPVPPSSTRARNTPHASTCGAHPDPRPGVTAVRDVRGRLATQGTYRRGACGATPR